MSNITFDIMWREAMMELLDQLEFEAPEDPSMTPTEFSEWTCIYLRYLGIYKKLELAYDQMVHPQKATQLRKALDATIGRTLELKDYLVQRAINYDFFPVDDLLVDLKLTPEALDIPVPRYYVDARAEELNARLKFLGALVDKYNIIAPTVDAPLYPLPPMEPEEALLVIQANERGRQGRIRARVMERIKFDMEYDKRREALGISSMTNEEAATKMQALMRGFSARRKIHKESREELVFIGMRFRHADKENDPSTTMVKNFVRRKLVKGENYMEYMDALDPIKQRMAHIEGPAMRETIQDKINAWLVENRHPTTGEYPDLPDEEEGGSKNILNPPPELEPEEKKGKKAKGKGGKDAKSPKDKKEKKGKKAKKEPPPKIDPKDLPVPNFFVPLIEQGVQNFVATWQDKDESGNFWQKHDGELAKEGLRPVVFEKVRLEVDDEMRVLIENLKDMVIAERAAKTGKKAKKKKGKKKKGKGKKKKGKEKKKKKDPTADRSIESIFAELASHGLVEVIPKRNLDEYIGSYNFIGSAQESANIVPDGSMSQVRNFLAEHVALPLGSQLVHEKAPILKTCLLYGLPQTGKTTLAHAIANETGAVFLNLSPRKTDGLYGGKGGALLIHMIFKIARVLSPAVVYIDEVEKVFIKNKKIAKQFKEQGYKDPPNRILKLLLKEVKGLAPGERVVVIGNSCKPQLAVKKDMKAMIKFFQRQVYCPLPDYASVRLLWPALITRYGGFLNQDFDLTSLAQLTVGYSPGMMVEVCRSMLTHRRLVLLKERGMEITLDEMIKHLSKMRPIAAETEEELRTWTLHLPWSVAKRGPPPKPPKKKKKGKK
ncbi:dynein regulatory complex subunit 11 [Pycnococcus provasolii]